MSSWPLVRLGDICEKITDGTHHSPANHAEGDFKYVTAKNIKPWGLDLSDITYIDAATHKEIYARCDVRKGDLLYVKDGVNTGRVAINPLDEEFSLLSSVAVLRPGPAVQAKYLAFALQESQTLDRMLADMAGVAITRLTLRKLNDAEIPLAPLSCQGRIVEKLEELLSDLDAGVAELKAAQRKLAQYRQSLLKAAVEGALTADWRATHARSCKPQETGADLLQRILAERRARWEAKQRAKYAEQGKSTPNNWQAKYAEPAVPDLTGLASLPEGWTQVTGELLFTWGSGDFLPGTAQRAGLFSIYGGNGVTGTHDEANVHDSTIVVGRVGVHCGNVYLAKSACWVTDNAIFATSKLDAISWAYAELALRAANIGTNSKGGAQPFVSQKTLNDALIRLPPLEEQAAVVESHSMAVEAVNELEQAITHSTAQATAQRKNILKAAFAGQLVPQDPNDEAASTLLERIRTVRAGQAHVQKPRGRKPRTTA